MGNVRFELARATGNLFQWKLFSSADKLISTSKGHASKEEAMKGIWDVKESVPSGNRLQKTNGGKTLGFKLKSVKHELVAEGDGFKDEAELDAAIAELQKAKEAAVVDKT